MGVRQLIKWDPQTINRSRDGTITVTAEYKCIADRLDEDLYSGIVDPVTGLTLPGQDDFHPIYTKCKVSNRSAQRTAGTEDEWIITVTYDNEQIDQGTEKPDQGENNPLTDPVLKTFGIQVVQAPFTKEIDGSAVQNSAGQGFDPPATYRKYLPTLTYIRNESYSTPETNYLVLNGACNNAAYNGYDIDQIQCASCIPKIEQRNGFTYYAVTYHFQFTDDPSGFQPSFLDQGSVYKDGTKTKKPYKDNRDYPVPIMLDGAGGWQDDPDSPPVYLDFQAYERSDLGSLITSLEAGVV